MSLSWVHVLHKTSCGIRHCNVVVAQWRQRNVQKSVRHMQSCRLPIKSYSFLWFSLMSPSSLLKLPIGHFFPALVTVPEVFATVNQAQFPSRFLRWCYKGRFPTTIFCATQNYNVRTMFSTIWTNVATILQRCDALEIVVANRPV